MSQLTLCRFCDTPRFAIEGGEGIKAKTEICRKCDQRFCDTDECRQKHANQCEEIVAESIQKRRVELGLPPKTDREAIFIWKPQYNDLDAKIAPAYRYTLEQLISKNAGVLIIDHSNLVHSSSSHMGVLAAFNKKCRDLGQDARFVFPQSGRHSWERLIRMFMLRILKCYLTVEDALSGQRQVLEDVDLQNGLNRE
jgi:hypothetical protein